MGQIQASMPAIGWGGVGFVGTTALPAWAGRFFPAMVPDKATNPMGHYLVKGISAFAVGSLVGMFAGRRAGTFAFAGGGINLAADVIATFAGPMLGLGEYIDTGIDEYIGPGNAMGYLSPGLNVEGGAFETDEPVSRLNPDNRF